MRSELTNTEDDAKQFDSLHEECGVFGIYQNQTAPVAASVYYGLYALQHRGQESCGMAICDDGVFRQYKGDGLVADVFTKKALAGLGEGNIAIGHVRYSTTGGKNANNRLIMEDTNNPVAINTRMLHLSASIPLTNLPIP